MILTCFQVCALDSASERFAKSFLFTTEEVADFLRSTQVSPNSFRHTLFLKPLRRQSRPKLKDLKGFYNSYCAYRRGGTIPLFNPWSVTNAIAQCWLDYYWKHTSSNVPIRTPLWSRSPRLTDLITELLAGKTVELQYQVMASYEG